MPSRFALLALSLAAFAPAQDVAWRLPPRGAVEYRRVLSEHVTTADSRADVAKAEARDDVPSTLLPDLAMPPWLCEGELAADRLALGDEPRDLRDVVRAVAFDLRLRGAAKLRYLRLVPFGDLVITGRVELAGADGAQTFTLQVETAEPQMRPGEAKASMAKYVRPLCKHSATGTLAVTRQFDAEAGVVRSFDAELTLVFEFEKGKWRKLEIRDKWDLVAVHDNQDAAFRAAVADAIRKAGSWLKRELGKLDRRHLLDERDENRSYGSGRIALALLTLLHAETPPDDPVVVKAFEELRRRELTDTYSLGVALMALSARYAPPNEAEHQRTGVRKTPQPRTLSDEDREAASSWLAKLRTNIDTRVDEASVLRFNYVAGPRFDNSVNQYGLLGLQSAQLCQLDVPAHLWRAAAKHLIDVQVPANKRDVRLVLTSYRELALAQQGDAVARGTASAVAARGYAYHTPDRPPYGSMTSAGISGLAIARAGMLQGGLGKDDSMPKIDAAIASGFAWLAAEFHVRSNPGYVDRADDNWYYYLYGLERSCELTGTALVQGRDWYYEGALQLLAMQNDNGTFRPERRRGLMLDATCFAVLFLKKATLPAVTGG
jgi:hypothetical protein